MALAIYLNKSIFPVVVNSEDFSGGTPATLSIDSGDAFVGNTADPLVVAALAAGFIMLLQSDPSNYLAAAGLTAGTSDAETVGPMFVALSTAQTSLTAALGAISGGPSTLTSVSGNSQTALHSTTLPSPFVVVVRTAGGAPVSGVVVAWAVTAGGGSLTTTSTVTNGSGRASVTLTLGSGTGTNTVTAAASGGAGVLTGSPVTFTATAT